MGASASGQKALAIESARKLAAAVPPAALTSAPILQGFLVVPYYAMVRFSDWDAILAEPAPSFDSAFTRGIWRYARALALVNRGRIDEADRELVEIRTLAGDASLKGQTTFSSNTGVAIVQIAPEIVAGEIALKRGEIDRAIAHFDRAVRYEDALVYQEPPDWHVPARQNLAVALLAADRAAGSGDGAVGGPQAQPRARLDARTLVEGVEAAEQVAGRGAHRRALREILEGGGCGVHHVASGNGDGALSSRRSRRS